MSAQDRPRYHSMCGSSEPRFHRGQQHLLHQTLATADNRRSTIGDFLLELLSDAVDEIAILIPAGEKLHFQALFGSSGRRVSFIEQIEPRGYAHAISQASEFVGDSPFIHLVGDHFYLADQGDVSSLTAELIRIHVTEGCSVSAVTPTREGLLPYFGAVGGPALGAKLYQVDTVIEKPTPTEAERMLAAAGLRQGHYLCFFGIHLFTPGLMHILREQLAQPGPAPSLSDALQILARRERYLATVLPGRRFDIGAKYGLLQAQLALGLRSPDREEILTMMLELSAR
ncbi:MAG: sugar phosphate nucleotidyltransferase, partial [Saprospiraceae bacterium]